MLRKTNDFTTISRESNCVNMKLDVLAFQNFAKCLSFKSQYFKSLQSLLHPSDVGECLIFGEVSRHFHV